MGPTDHVPAIRGGTPGESHLEDLLQELSLEQLLAVAGEEGADRIAGDGHDLPLSPDRMLHDVAAHEGRAAGGKRPGALELEGARAGDAGATPSDRLLEERAAL